MCHRRNHSWGIALIFLAAAVPGEAAARQAEVRVVDGGGIPVPAAQIEVYGTAELLGIVSSGSDGVATLPVERWNEVRRISLTHLGFQTLIVQSDEIVPGMTLRLEPEALTLEGLDVEVSGDLCPVEDSEYARSLWADVASGYSTDTGQRRLHASYLRGAGSVMETSLHLVSESSLEEGSGSRQPGGGRASVGVLEAVIQREGYSWEPPRTQWGRRNLNRVYPSLEMWHAYHFATHTFGAMHAFTVVRDQPESTVLAFCPRPDSEGTQLMGTLELVPGDRLVRATWRFIVDDPDENAGGEVEFVTHRTGTRRLPHLLANQGMFFRHNGRKPPYPDLPRAYYREAVAKVEWQVLPPSSER